MSVTLGFGQKIMFFSFLAAPLGFLTIAAKKKIK